jgi:hypothetical protein
MKQSENEIPTFVWHDIPSLITILDPWVDPQQPGTPANSDDHSPESQDPKPMSEDKEQEDRDKDTE